MDNSSLITIVVFLLACYAFFSACETSFSSLSKIKLKALASNEDKGAERALSLAENYTQLLTTVLIGNTIVNVLATSLATIFFTKNFGINGVAYASVFITFMILVFGEILPKCIAKSIPEKFAIAAAPILKLLCFVFTPLSWVFGFIQKASSLFFKDNSETFSTEEMLTIVEEANEEGNIEDHEADLISNALEFNDLDVGSVFTPRIDVIAIDIEKDTIEDIELKYRDSGYSRLPVYKDNLDNVLGVLIEKDFYYHLLYEHSVDIQQILKEAVYTSSQVKISSLLKQLQSSKSHMAIVADEYGGTEGIITMEDILEELVGEIYDEHDEVIEYYKKVDENVYLVQADADIEDMFEHFAIENKEEFDFNTVSAWVIDMFDRIPEAGDSFDYKNLHVEVTNADSKKVNEIKLTIKQEEKHE